ncbi:RNA polymerase sigma factor [Paenibacillus ginsengarvi]|uniref:RNA polymerase sigma factor n=1 Tax=Paenibacillus ginsengarvi TaxID=400777 RepID=UPI001315614C|nr:RNA polymerase sigma factor [Paenibacillus ginsengarvi]
MLPNGNGRPEGRNDGFRKLFETYYGLVYRSAYSITKDHYLAQDVVQETFMKAYCHLGSLKGRKFGAWLKAISRNTAIDYYRRALRRGETLGLSVERSTASAEAMPERYIELKCLRELFLALDAPHRQALLLVYEYGLTYEQLAQVQQLSIGAVKSRIHRAKTKLKSMLRSLEHSG